MTDVVDILARRRRLTQWDIKPPGYENVTAEQAKLSGNFPPRKALAFSNVALQACFPSREHLDNNLWIPADFKHS